MSSSVDVQRAMVRTLDTCSRTLPRKEAEAVEGAVNELGTYLVRVARGGTINVSMLDDGKRIGVELKSEDAADAAASREDAAPRLAAAKGLMDSFQVKTGPKGTVITARKWAPKAEKA
jgi:hypothetical protein